MFPANAQVTQNGYRPFFAKISDTCGKKLHITNYPELIFSSCAFEVHVAIEM